MSTVWIVSLALAWVVIALLAAGVVTLLRQVGELRSQITRDGVTAADDVVAVGPQLYDEVEPVQVPVLGARGSTVAVGGEQPRPALLVHHAPGCSSCADIEEALEAVAVERPDVAVISVIALKRSEAAKHAGTSAQRHAVPVAVQDLPRSLVPPELPALVAIAREGVVAAIGEPDLVDHLREAANVAVGAVLIAGPDSMRDTEWGRTVPAWDVDDAPALDIVFVESERDRA